MGGFICPFDEHNILHFDNKLLAVYISFKSYEEHNIIELSDDVGWGLGIWHVRCLESHLMDHCLSRLGVIMVSHLGEAFTSLDVITMERLIGVG